MPNPVRAIPRKKSSWGVVMASLAFATMLTIATIGGLAAAGIVSLPFMAQAPSRVGLVPVPMSNQPIPAFTKLTRDHVADPRTGGINLQWLPEKQLSESIIRDPSLIVGRVLSHDKLPQYAFVEEDFLPPGTRPGLVGGTPPGKRSLTLDAEHLSGVHGVRAGDHIDLVSTTTIDSQATGGRTDVRSKALAAQLDAARMRKRATVRVLAQDAVVVKPVTTRAKPTTVRSLMSGSQTKTVPVQEIVIAVNPEEVAPVSEAVATEATLACVIRSGRPDDPGPSIKTPGADPLNETPIEVVESIRGNNRDIQVVSRWGTLLKPSTSNAEAPSPAESAVKPAAAPARVAPRPRGRISSVAADRPAP